MKFFTIVVCGFLTILLPYTTLKIDYDNLNFIYIDLLIIGSIGLLLWIYFGTIYKLNETEFKYKSGPISGEMKIEKITEIIVGRTMSIGIRPATALNGLIVKCGGYDEVYVSPETNESFVEKILEVNKEIKIIKTKKTLL